MAATFVTPEPSAAKIDAQTAKPSTHQRLWQALEAEYGALHPGMRQAGKGLSEKEAKKALDGLEATIQGQLKKLGPLPAGADDTAIRVHREAERQIHSVHATEVQVVKFARQKGLKRRRERLKAKRSTVLKLLEKKCEALDEKLALKLDKVERKARQMERDELDRDRDKLERRYDKWILRTLNDELHRLPAGDHAALCLSGGGIRSATFALGVLQGLARYGTLQRFAYLSTVSGGGYIGSWLSSWIHNHARKDFQLEAGEGNVRHPTENEFRAAEKAVIQELGRPPSNAGPDQAEGDKARADHDPIQPEPEPLMHLRRYSNYLTPKLGYFSADTWTVVATVLRNLLLTWLLLLPAILIVLLLPRFAYTAMAHWTGSWPLSPVLAVVGGLLAAVWALRHLVTAPEETGRPGGQRRFLRHALAPLWLSGALLLLAWGWSVQNMGARGPWMDSRSWWALGAGCGLIAGLLTWVACLVWPAQKATGATTVTAVPPAPPQDQNGKGKTAPPDQNKHREWWLLFICVLAGLALGWSGGKVVELAKDHALEKAGEERREQEFAATLVWQWTPFGGVAGPPVARQSPVAIPAEGTPERAAAIKAFTESLPETFATKSTGATLSDEAKFQRYVVRQHLLRGAVSLGLTVFLLVLFLALTIYMGGRSHRMADDRREWFARANGWAFIAGTAWAIVGSVVLWGPDWLAWLAANMPKATALLGGGAGLLTILGGGASGSPATAGEKEKRGPRAVAMQWAVKLAAPIFAVALLMLLSLFTSWLLEKVAWRPAAPTLPNTTWHESVLQASHLWLLVALLFGLMLLASAASRWINVNRFSLNAMYRNRLIRAYLGASRGGEKRQPDSFTGFDGKDNFPVAELQGQRPFHVLNMALNVVAGSELAWQERQAESFTVTPLTCGSPRLGYRPSKEYAFGDDQIPMTLGTAVSISGAAASPNHGYNSSAPVAFLMTLFNARLGAWFGNPGLRGDIRLKTLTADLARRIHPGLGAAFDALFEKIGRKVDAAYRMEAPPRPLAHLAKEALGLTSDQEPFVYLSDGGHFENLGLYEMVMRRCSFILVSDAGCDPKHHFQDLGNAIAKIRVDLGIPINFTGEIPIYPRGVDKRPECAEQRRYAVVGKICYSAMDGSEAQDGTLIYLKPTLCDIEPVDVFHYAQESSDFPHESTSDQWFSESQFESYRMLGFHAVRAIYEDDLPNPETGGDDQPLSERKTFDYLVSRIDRHQPRRPRGGTQIA